MNLLDAVSRAIEDNAGRNSEYLSYEAFTLYQSLKPKQKKLINQFFENLFSFSFDELLNWCGGSIPKPITRYISIYWSIEHVKQVRPDLIDEQAANVLETLITEYNPLIGIDLDIVEKTCEKLFPSPL